MLTRRRKFALTATINSSFFEVLKSLCLILSQRTNWNDCTERTANILDGRISYCSFIKGRACFRVFRADGLLCGFQQRSPPLPAERWGPLTFTDRRGDAQRWGEVWYGTGTAARVWPPMRGEDGVVVGANPSTGLEAGPPPLRAGEVFGERRPGSGCPTAGTVGRGTRPLRRARWVNAVGALIKRPVRRRRTICRRQIQDGS